MTNDLEDLIADYLSGTLGADARQELEQRMAADPELALRVKLEKDIAEALGNSPENQLRASLRDISEKYNTPEALGISVATSASDRRRFRKWWLLAGGVLLLAGIVLWGVSQRGETAKPAPTSLPAPEIQTPAPQDVPADVPADDPQPKQKRSIDPSRPVAAAFKPIPALETYVGSQYRGADIKILVDHPYASKTVSRKDGKVNLQLSGKVAGNLTADQSLKALLLSNNVRDFEAMRPVISTSLMLSADQMFIFQKQINLPIGLYYILIEEEQSGEWVYVDKFMVK